MITINLDKNIILIGKVGSHSYGTNLESSDLDYKGVIIPSIDYFLGLKSFDGYFGNLLCYQIKVLLNLY